MEIINTIADYPWLATTLCTLLGLLVGSFLNVVIYRLPIMMEREWRAQCSEALELADTPEQERFNLAYPSSTCPHCDHKITPWENIPILSYLWLRGRCSSCKTSISPRYPMVEAISGIMSGLVAVYFGFTPLAFAILLLTWSLIALTMIDYDHHLLPDSITLPLLWLGLIVNSLGGLTDLQSSLWGAIAGYMVLWLVYWGFKIVTGKEGMGFGDFKLLAALGAWMGWQMLPLIIIMSSLVGALVGILLIAGKGRESSRPIPFGPFLATAGWITLLWGELLIDQYWHFLGIG